MKVVLFGATGMIGQGVLRECLRDDTVTEVLAVGRRATGTHHPKLTDLVHDDLTDLSPLADRFAGIDACLFCLGISSAGMSEADYRHVTYDLALAAARAMPPGSRFLYISGAGTDSTGQSRVMWARVKGQTENALFDLPVQAYALRPGIIQPLHGSTSRTRLYRLLYLLARPLFPLVRRIWPASVTTTEQLGRAMLTVAATGTPTRVLETRDLIAIGSVDT